MEGNRRRGMEREFLINIYNELKKLEGLEAFKNLR